MKRLVVCLVVCGFMVHAETTHASRGTSPRQVEPGIAPIDQYLMDRGAEIALARSAAPAAISRDAQVWVLERQGYVKAVEGTNGFVCIVERGWTASLDDPSFGGTRLVAPMCLNAAGAHYRLPLIFLKTRWALARPSIQEMADSIKAAATRGVLPVPGPNAMCYMLSKAAFYGATVGNFAPHVMFFFPSTAVPPWGAGATGSPLGVHQDPDERLSVVYVRVEAWSDGSPGPGPSPHT